MATREFKLNSGIKILLGKDSNGNDELVKKFQGKENFILHTVESGSPFCVINVIPIEVNKSDIQEAAIICAAKSQDWRDNQKSVKVHLFTGLDVYKNKSMKSGTWGLKVKPKIIKAKKKDIIKWLSDNSN